MKKTFSPDTIKIIAMILMAVDHIGLGIVEPLYLTATDYNKSVAVYNIYILLRTLGRVAFPLFAYQTVNGFVYTKSRIKYIRNVLIFALISEIPFDLLDMGKFVDFSYQNVMFTLVIGLMMMCAIERIEKSGDLIKTERTGVRKTLVYGTIFLVVVVFAAFAQLLRTDYGAKGIILVAILYLLRNNRKKLVEFGPLAFVVEIFFVMLITTGNASAAVNYCQFEIFAVLAFWFMYYDDGKRKGGKLLKWTGYCFYPVHMLLIYFAAMLIK